MSAARGLWLLPLIAVLLAGCPWDKDMVDQPVARAQRQPAPPDPGGIPVEGGEWLPAPVDEVGMFNARRDAAALVNPVPRDAGSLASGAALYATNCAVCHGASGAGDGPVGQLFEPAPANLADEQTQQQTDGELFFTLTRGRGAMPAYRDALSHEERWAVIHYLRDEFGP